MPTKYENLTEEQYAKKKAATAAWRERNREKVRAQQRERHLKLKDDPDYIAKRKASAEKHYKSAETNPERFVNYLFGGCKSGAKDRGIKFSLTKEDIRELCIESNGKCALSGLPLTTERNNPMKASVDRIDSNKGYTRDNIQLVGAMVNKAKNDLTTEMFIILCKGVAENGTV